MWLKVEGKVQFVIFGKFRHSLLSQLLFQDHNWDYAQVLSTGC